MSYSRDITPLSAIRSDPERPILLSGGCVLTRDATLGDWAKADVLIGGSKIVGIGPGLASAADDDGMIMVDSGGCIVMPAGAGRLAPMEKPISRCAGSSIRTTHRTSPNPIGRSY